MNNKKYTKIVATISDKRCSVDFIKELYEEGMNVVRMNSAHLDQEGFEKIINNVRQVSKNIALLVDTKGPEIRTTKAENDQIILKNGAEIKIIGDKEHISTAECIGVSYPHFTRDLQIGDLILIDDGEIELEVTSKDDVYLTCLVKNDGKLGSRKSVNTPGVRIKLPSITERDKMFIRMSIEQNIDFIAHSFVRTANDVKAIQQELDKYESHIKIISKIENQEGVDNIDEILENSYGIMIARGDLGIEVPQEKIPAIQRRLIRKSVQARKPVIVATQMLHSMIENPRPTRAEVTDIANAIYYRTDALMLSGETAYGKYPVEAVKMMSKIASESEKSKMPENNINLKIHTSDVTSFLAHTSVEAGVNMDLKAIITDTYTGQTARYLSAYRSLDPVIAVCYVDRASRELALSYGVFPIFNEKFYGEENKYFQKALESLIENKVFDLNDKVCYLSGPASGNYGTTFMEINTTEMLLKEVNKKISLG